jgi:hypothetical protein
MAKRGFRGKVRTTWLIWAKKRGARLCAMLAAGEFHGSIMVKTPKVRKSLLFVVINEVIPAVR